jgi:ubiquinone/menaquinone biosynthesis C-methylase UbiE
MWLAENPHRLIFAADNSADMLAIAEASQPMEVLKQVKPFRTSVFAIGLDANAVDCIFCIRLLHHIEQPEHRLTILREFHRVSRDTVILSLWVDGNQRACHQEPESVCNRPRCHRKRVPPNWIQDHRPTGLSAGLRHVAHLRAA